MMRMLSILSVLAVASCGNEQSFVGDMDADGAPSSPPFAVVQGVTLAHIDEAIALDGTASYDPDDDDAELLYTWTVVSAPDETEPSPLNFANTSTPEFVATALGTYELALVVTDEEAFDSENPAGVIIEVVPWEDLQVDIQWDLPGVDLEGRHDRRARLTPGT